MPLSVVPGRKPRGSPDWSPVEPLIDARDVLRLRRGKSGKEASDFRGRADAEALRAAALDCLVGAIDELVSSQGYRRSRFRWVKQSPRGITTIEIKRSNNGDRADILLDARRLDGGHPPGPWRGAQALRLGMFYHPKERALLPFEALAYLDVLEGRGLKAPMKVLGDRALPWLENMHSGIGGLKQIEQYLPAL